MGVWQECGNKITVLNLAGEFLWRRPVERPIRRQKGNTNMELREIDFEDFRQMEITWGPSDG
jgi:hypothetical protein